MLVTVQLNDADLKKLRAHANKALGMDGVQLALYDLLLALQGRTTVVGKDGKPIRPTKTKTKAK